MLLAITVPSRVDQIPQLVDQLLGCALSHHLIGDEDRSWFALCLEEALINSMVHGNEADPQLTVDITLARDRTCWRLAIRDAGTGFSLEDLTDTDAAAGAGTRVDSGAAASREHGRGLTLMGSWLDQLEYFNGGALALLGRRLSG